MSTQPDINTTEPKVLIIGTSPMNLYHHRLELIKELIANNIRVYLASPEGEEIPLIKNLGCEYIAIQMDNRGMNPIDDLKLLLSLIRIIKGIKPDLVLTFYTKTNIYGGLACRISGTPYIENITGLGSALGNGGLKSKVMARLYKSAIKKAALVYFQNEYNHSFFEEKNLYSNPSEMLPGSGVALDRHQLLEYPKESKKIKFAFLGRVLAQKGIFELIEAARVIKRKYPEVEIHIIGPAEGGVLNWLNELDCKQQIIYHGKVVDVRPILKGMHCTVFPSYYPEGMANVLLESAAAGRPLITTDCPGCKETVEDGVTGFLVKPRDSKSIVEAMERFIELPHPDKEMMGLNGRKKMEREFDRKIVTESYLNQINSILGRIS